MTARWGLENITWNAGEAGRGLLCALPGAIVAAGWNVSLGIGLALGTLPVTLLGLPPQRRQRPRLVLAGVAFAAAYAAGTVLVLSPPLAVVGIIAFSFGGVLLGSRRPAARLVPALMAPGLALGMNHVAPDGLLVALAFVVASLWATVVAVAWPQTVASSSSEPEHGRAQPTAARTATLRPADADTRARFYAAMYALAAGAGLAIAFVLDLVHVGWAAAAAMLIMRPDPGLSTSRAVERTAATFLGISAAALTAALDPTGVAIAVVTAVAVSAVTGTRGSRWYLSSAGTGFVVLLMSGVSGPATLAVTYRERLGETLVGAALALGFGVLAPAIAARGRAAISPSPD